MNILLLSLKVVKRLYDGHTPINSINFMAIFGRLSGIFFNLVKLNVDVIGYLNREAFPLGTREDFINAANQFHELDLLLHRDIAFLTISLIEVRG